MEKQQFKPGDKVICTSPGKEGFVGVVGHIYRVKNVSKTGTWLDLEVSGDSGNHWGVSLDRFKLYEGKGSTMAKFKVGDRVKLVKNTCDSMHKVGFVGYVTEYRKAENSDYGNWSYETDLVAFPEVQYEDEWHLNTGAVDIPDDADKAWNSDKTSVVAFRYVKKPKIVVKEQFLNTASDGNGFILSHNKYKATVAKVTLTTTDGELTDIQWEKI